MHKARSKTEKYIGANWLARQLGLNRGRIHYWAIKMRLRYFKFSGVRYIEQEDAKSLVEILATRFPVDKSDALSKIENY